MSSENEQSAEPGAGPPEQLALIRETVRRAKVPRAKPRTWRGAPLADDLPVARVLVNKGVLHLDQYFDYAVPQELDADAQPGVRVRVRFGAGGRNVQGGRREGGGLIDGFIVERRADSDYPGALAALASVVSPEPVLGPELLALCRAVADRYAGSLADVLQLAVPPRNGRAEAKPSRNRCPRPRPRIRAPGREYGQGPAFLRALAEGGAPRAVWTALPGPHWPAEIAGAVAATLSSGRGALVVVPDGRAAARVDAALTEALGAGRHALLTAESGPESATASGSRYAGARCGRSWVPGTAMFAPVRDLGLVVVWDDGDSSHSDDNAPFPHVREVLELRAAQRPLRLPARRHQLHGRGRPARGERLGAAPPGGPRTAAPGRAPHPYGRGRRAGPGRGRPLRPAAQPRLGGRARRPAHRTGADPGAPAGYAPRLACERCRTPARCRHCAGPLEAPDQQDLNCAWCGQAERAWSCAECGSTRLRARIVGARRTAEELGRAFPAVPVRTSGRDHILDGVPDAPALVVSTPGAEPVAEGGYAAALLLDGWAMLGRPDLRAGEEALRRWLAASALVRGQEEGGTVVVVAEPTERAVQALVAGIRRGSPGGSWRTAPSWASRRSPGWPR